MGFLVLVLAAILAGVCWGPLGAIVAALVLLAIWYIGGTMLSALSSRQILS